MLQFLGLPEQNKSYTESEIKAHVETCERRARDARITAIALVMVSLVIFALACAALGIGTMPAEMLYGLNSLPYLGGVFIRFLAIGTFCGALVFSAVASVRDFQSKRWQNKLAS